MRRSRAIPALFCALALFGCAQDPASNISQQTDEQTQPLSQHESQEPFPAISAELTDAFIVRENSSKEYLVINTEIENHSSQDVELHTGGIVENGVLTVSSDNNLLCSWGNTHLFSDSLEPANPDYIEPIGYTIPANMSSTTAQFVYTLFDEQNGYYGNSTQPISFVLKPPWQHPPMTSPKKEARKDRRLTPASTKRSLMRPSPTQIFRCTQRTGPMQSITQG